MRARISRTSASAKDDQYKEFADYNELVKYCFTLHGDIILSNRQRHDEHEQFDIEA